MAIKPALNQFNGGEISPILEGRTDWQKYNYSAKLCQNFIPTVEGSLKRRGGSHFIDVIPNDLTFSLNITVNVPDEVALTPELTVNGKIITLEAATSEEEGYNTYTTSTLSFSEGEYVELKISGFGVKTETENFYIDEDKIKTYTLTEEETTDVTLTVVLSDDSIELTLNGTEDNPYTTTAGVPIVWVATYQGNTNTGTVYIYENKTMLLYINNGVPFLGGENMLEVNSPATGEIYFDSGRYRIKAVGGGGAAVRNTFHHSSGKSYGGGGGAFVDAIITLEGGLYTWQCGQKQRSSYAGGFQTGTPTFLKIENTSIVEAGTPNNNISNLANGGIATVNDSYIEQIYTKQNGNYGGTGLYSYGHPLYGDYGKGEEMKDNSPAWAAAGTDGYLKIEKLEG